MIDRQQGAQSIRRDPHPPLPLFLFNEANTLRGQGEERGLSAPNLAVAKWEREDEEEEEEEGRVIDSS